MKDYKIPIVPGRGAPSVEIGLTPVVGTADEYMSSDSAPALSVAITPIWTGGHIFRSSVDIQTDLTGIDWSAQLTNRNQVSGFAGAGWEFRVTDTDGTEIESSRISSYRTGLWDGTAPNRNGNFSVDNLIAGTMKPALLMTQGATYFYDTANAINFLVANASGWAGFGYKALFDDGTYKELLSPEGYSFNGLGFGTGTGGPFTTDGFTAVIYASGDVAAYRLIATTDNTVQTEIHPAAMFQSGSSTWALSLTDPGQSLWLGEHSGAIALKVDANSTSGESRVFIHENGGGSKRVYYGANDSAGVGSGRKVLCVDN